MSGQAEGANASGDGAHPDPAPDKAVEEPGIPLSTVFMRFTTTTHKVMFIIGFIAAAASGTSMPLFSIMFRDILDSSNTPGGIIEGVRKAAIFGICCGAALLVTCWIYTGLFMYLGEVIMMNMRISVFRSMLRQELGWYESHKPGAMSVFITSDILKIKESLGEKLGQCVFNFAAFIFGLGYGLYQCWSLTLVMLGVTPILAVCGAVMMKVVQSLDAKGDVAYSRAGGIATEVLAAVRTVFVFNAQEYEVKRFENELEGARKATVKKGWVEGGAMGFTFLMAFSSYAIAFGYASYVIGRGWNTPGETIAAFFAVLVGAFQLGNAMPYFGTVGGARRVAKQCMDYMERKPEIDIDDNQGVCPPINGNLTFKGVSFRYPSRPKQQIFKDLDLNVPPGKKVAFVGGSGGGKSSIIGLMQRMYDPESGSVLIDGHDLRTINLKYFRDCVGVVAQEPVLFKGTILDNIKLSKPDANDFEVEEVAKMANIHETIMQLPSKYNTDVGDSGSQLSGGQRQRICIARALLKNPKILLLDEATSALDRQSEMEVQKALDSAMKGRSVATIAHRLVTISNSDVINYVMPPKAAVGTESDDEDVDQESRQAYSTISESGDHKALMALKGHYAHMVTAQSIVDGETKETVEGSGGGLMHSNHHEGDVIGDHDNGPSKDPEDDYDSKTYSVPFSRVLHESKPEIGFIIIGLCACILAACIWPAYGLLFTEVVAVFYKPHDQMKREIIKWCLLFVALGAATAVAWIFKQGMFSLSGAALTKRIRILLFRSILKQDMEFFDMKKYDSGALASVLSGDTAKVYLLFGPTIALQLQNFLTLVIALVIAFYYSWKLALVTLAGLPLMIISQMINWKMMEGFSAKGGGIYSEANTTVIESVSGIKTVMSYNLQDRQVELFTGQLHRSLQSARKSCIVAGFCVGTVQLVMFGMFALAFWYGSRLLDSGELTFDKVLRVVMIILMGGMGIGESSAISGTISEAKASAGNVYKIIDRIPKVNYEESMKSGKTLSSYRQDIEFSRVQFRYPSRPEQRILTGLKLRIPAGKQMALIGTTGCGKSTVIQLLERFYDPEVGSITVGGVSLKDLNLHHWRDYVGLVSQEPVLFDSTVEENIRYGRSNATMDEIREAATIAQIHEDIMKLPDQYKTKVGQRGSTMSGGQRQRIAIARAILKKPDILLFDEATAALDNVSEKEVQRALDAIVKSLGATVITIAHRLTSIQNVDYIAVLHSGVVVEAGTHEELYALGGDYRRRYDAYFGK